MDHEILSDNINLFYFYVQIGSRVTAIYVLMRFTVPQMVTALFHQSMIRMEKIKYSHKGKRAFYNQRSSAFPHL